MNEEEKYEIAKVAFTGVWEFVESVYMNVIDKNEEVFKPVAEIRRELMKFMYQHMMIKPE